MKKCCAKELRSYQQAVHAASCEIIHRDQDYRSVNRIRWAIEAGSRVAAKWRRGIRGRQAYKTTLPSLYAALVPNAERAAVDKEQK